MTHEAAIRDLESEKSRLKDKLALLEEERGLLQSKSQSMDESQKQHILALEKVTFGNRILLIKYITILFWGLTIFFDWNSYVKR